MRSLEPLVQSNFHKNPDFQGIGTLSERTLHAYVKHHLEPNTAFHEQKLMGYVVDIFDGNHIIEIQTKQFFKLIPKLNALLDTHPITIVYPIAHEKFISWVDPNTLETTPPRKSPKMGKPTDAIEEMYALRAYLEHPNLTIQLLFFDLLETRWLNGWSTDKKKGSHRKDRLPLRYETVMSFHTLQDYDQFLPEVLPETFASKDIKDQLKITLRKAQFLLNVLYGLNRIELVGKQGRYQSYRKNGC